MSEFTECNYCRLQRIKNDAKHTKMKCTILSDSTFKLGGVNIYVHPREVDIKSLPGGEHGPRKKYRVTWFMELGDRCCC